MNALKGILLKLGSILLFALMSAMIRWLGDRVPVGQVVFFRAAFGAVPVVAIYLWRRQLVAAIRTERTFGHVGRGLVGLAGMFFNFAALARLPLADATALTFAAPLITVALAWLVLGERVRVHRWTAVGVGFVGVVVMLVPYLDLTLLTGAASATATLGAAFALTAACCQAGAVVQTRRLTDTETTSSIVFYFSLICALGGLATWPLGWAQPTPLELAALIATGLLGGVSHLLLTESYRLAPASMVAPFDYTAILWAFLLGYAMFGEVPNWLVFVGAAIVTASGLYVIWRERQLGLERTRQDEGPPVAG